MKYAEFKNAKTFNQIVKDNGKNLFEVFVIGENAYTPKRYLTTITTHKDFFGTSITFNLHDKFGRAMYFSWSSWRLLYGEDANLNEVLETNLINYDGYSFILTKEAAYNHCIGVLRRKMQELRKKEISIHETIYKV